MLLESLANELLLDLFEFLDGIDLLRAFGGLNCRFETLLHRYVLDYHLDFRFVSKRDFDQVCRNYLPSIKKRVASLHVSDDDSTPNLLQNLFFHRFTFDQFISLRSLSFRQIPLSHVNRTASGFSSLTHLIHLTLIECYYIDANEYTRFLNIVWRLPKLKYFNDHSNLHTTVNFDGFEVVSSSIEYLNMKELLINSTHLKKLFMYTPQLRCLHAIFDCKTDVTLIHNKIPPIKTLNISLEGNILQVTRLLKKMNNLRYLTIQLRETFFNGHQWKEIIVNNFPQIKIFRFSMKLTLYNGNIINNMDELIETFQTSFWLHEHQWFTRFHWSTPSYSQNIWVYTLPYCLYDKFYLGNTYQQYKSTCPNNEAYWFYDCVQSVVIESNSLSSSSSSPVCLRKIQDLNIKLPIQRRIWSSIPNLEHLKSLNVSQVSGAQESKLLNIINRAPSLYSLTIPDQLAVGLMRLTITNTSIRQLYIRHSYAFNVSDCSELAHSSLGRQCEVLSITVESRDNVLYLINNMSNLRALRFNIDVQIENNDVKKSQADVISSIDWLKKHLKFKYSFHHQGYYIRLWINR